MPSFEVLADILRGLKVSDGPLGELNAERRVKISARFSKEDTLYNIFTVKFEIVLLSKKVGVQNRHKN